MKMRRMVARSHIRANELSQFTRGLLFFDVSMTETSHTSVQRQSRMS